MRTLALLFALLVSTGNGIAQEIPWSDVSLHSGDTPAFVLPDHRAANPANAPVQPWQLLDRLRGDERTNARVTVDPGIDASQNARELAYEAAVRWNRGEYTKAIGCVTALGSLVDPRQVEIVIQWKFPQRTTQANLLNGNIRVGTLDSIRAVGLATDSAGTMLFAVLSQSGDGYGGSFHIHISSDGGATWGLTQTVASIGTGPQLGLAAAGNYLYVGYPRLNSKELRVRKFSLFDGSLVSMTNGLSYSVALSLGGSDSIRGIAGASNQPKYNNRPYFAVSTALRKGRCLWTETGRDSLWGEISDPSAVGVTEGISLAYSYAPPSTHRLFMSYIDSLGRACIDTCNAGGTAFARSMAYAGAANSTSVSAYGDTALCAFTYLGTTAHFRYLISYNGGTSWNYGFPVDTTKTHEAAAAMLQRGQGMGIFYRFYSLSGRDGQFVYRSYKTPAVWSAPVTVTTYQAHYWPYGIVALGEKTFGMVYITYTSVPATQAAIFARYQVPSTGVEDSQPVMPARYSLSQNFPNPFNPSTEIRYETGASGPVKLTVHDLLGREVAILVDGIQPAGQKILRWNAAGLASGLYFCRLQAGDFSSSIKLIFMK